jgi:hypothetical protein
MVIAKKLVGNKKKDRILYMYGKSYNSFLNSKPV